VGSEVVSSQSWSGAEWCASVPSRSTKSAAPPPSSGAAASPVGAGWKENTPASSMLHICTRIERAESSVCTGSWWVPPFVIPRAGRVHKREQRNKLHALPAGGLPCSELSSCARQRGATDVRLRLVDKPGHFPRRGP
jgi:hypothetical protein